MKKNNRTLKAFGIAAFIVVLSFVATVVLIAFNNQRADINVTGESVSENVSDNVIPITVSDNKRDNKKTSEESVYKTYSLDEEELIILHNAYASALSSICEGQIWIDDKSNKVCNYLGYWTYAKKADKDKNNYSICDIDEDGIEELIVEVNNADAATKISVIYQYDIDENEFYREASFYPGAVFFDNDIVFDEWSHNQGVGNFIWPYSVYKYDRESNAYYFVSQVDSWNKEIKAEGFPEDVDLDKDGNVVIISSAQETKYLDNDDYYQWITEITEGSLQKTIDYQPIIPANYLKYAKDYIKYMISKVEEEKTDTDIGIVYALSEDSVNAVKDYLEGFCNINFSKSKDKKFSNVIKDSNGIYFGIDAKDNNTVIYNQKFENITLFGIYPGMKEKMAIAAVDKYGFTGGDFGVYKLGSEGWHIELTLECENGEVNRVALCWNSDYAN